jgi:Flp pilus assembly protein TadG
MAREQRPGRRLGDVGDEGQATVEVVLVLPLLLLVALGILQVALVARDVVAVHHAAREAVRAAAVEPGPGAAAAAAGRVLPGATSTVVVRGAIGEPVRVRGDYRSPTDVPLIGPLLPDADLHAEAVMRVER